MKIPMRVREMMLKAPLMTPRVIKGTMSNPRTLKGQEIKMSLVEPRMKKRTVKAILAKMRIK